MIKRPIGILIAQLIAIGSGGCALVSDVHRVEDGSRKHTVAIFGILPLWHTERPPETAQGAEE